VIWVKLQIGDIRCKTHSQGRTLQM